MAQYEYDNESPLSMTASVAGILTFLVAIGATIWLRINSLRSADTEYFRVKTALNWYKTESEWINDLIATQRQYRNDRGRTSVPRHSTSISHPHPISNHSPTNLRRGSEHHFQASVDKLRRARGHGGKFHEELDTEFTEKLEAWKKTRESESEKQLHRVRETEMYLFVLDQLKTLQDRLLEVVTGVEFRAEARTGARKSSGNGVGGRDEEGGWNKTGWGWVPGRWGTRTEIAVQWLPVRSKALELMRQREALGNRVLFAQLAMIGSRLADQEERASMQEQRIQELLDIIKSFDGDDVVHL